MLAEDEVIETPADKIDTESEPKLAPSSPELNPSGKNLTGAMKPPIPTKIQTARDEPAKFKEDTRRATTIGGQQEQQQPKPQQKRISYQPKVGLKSTPRQPMPEQVLELMSDNDYTMKPQSHFDTSPREKPIEKPKGDSFFRDYDDANLNFSKTIDSGKLRTFNLTKTSALAPSDSTQTLDSKTQTLFKKKKPLQPNPIHFVDHDQLEISPVNSTSEDSPSIHQETLNQEIQANLNKSYKMGFAWGDKGSVEIRSMKYSIEYCTHAAGFKLKSSDNTFLRTEIQWGVSEAYEGVYLFSMRDKENCNLTTGKNVRLVLPG